MAREFRVTRALGAAGVPVPPAVVLCEEDRVIGAPFAVAGFVDGKTVQTRADLDGLDDTAVADCVDRLVEVLAGLHAVDHVAAGLERFGRPDGYSARQLRRWSSPPGSITGTVQAPPTGPASTPRVTPWLPCSKPRGRPRGRCEATVRVAGEGVARARW